MIAADAFCALLQSRLAMAQHEPTDRPLLGPAYRCDPLFEAGADFSDMVVAFSAGRVGESVLREEALRVAALACRIYWATVTGAKDGD